jgi:hypothetical protein
MARLIFENLTFEEARALGGWWYGQGEQDYEGWGSVRGSLYTDDVIINKEEEIVTVLIRKKD